MDETALSLNYPLRSCWMKWMKRGQQKEIPAFTGERDYLHVIGAYSWASAQVSHLTVERKNSDTFIAFLEQLAAEYPFQSLILVMDNASYHHSDQGLQDACADYTNLLPEEQVQISMAAVGKPEENGFAERLMRTIKEEEVDLSDYSDFHHAYQRIGRFLDDVCTRKRIHAALGYLTPSEFEAQWQLKAVS